MQPLIFLSSGSETFVPIAVARILANFVFSSVQCRVLQGFVINVVKEMREMIDFHSEGFCQKLFHLISGEYKVGIEK